MVFSGIIFDDTKRKKSWEKMNKISRTKKALHQHMLPLLFQDKASVRRNHVAVVFLLLVGVCVLLSTTKLAALNNNGMSEDLNEVCKKSVPSWSAKDALDASESIERKIRTRLASESMNCSAPDTGNMEVLERVGTEAQKKQWLEPLLNGEIRSAYAMTEPNLASSDAKNISTSAVLDGDEWVINGEKFYISGAGDPRCKIMITMVKTSPDAHPSKQQSQILVPKDTPGVQILEGMQVFGHDHAPHGHMHIKFDNVRVPKENILLGEGKGFEISQVRLGPGRIHHCMRTIGKAEIALELMVKRAGTREAFGKPIAKLGGNLEIISRARIEINAMRLAVLQAAKAMDVLGNKEARVYVSAIKAMVPEKACKIIDQAIQMHGAAGISQWTPLAGLYTDIRHLRFADGPDEVHHMVVGRAEMQKYDLW